MPWLRERVGFSFQDLAAALVSLVVVIGVVVLAAQQKTVPNELSTALGAALGWLYTRSGHIAGRDEQRQTPEKKP